MISGDLILFQPFELSIVRLDGFFGLTTCGAILSTFVILRLVLFDPGVAKRFAFVVACLICVVFVWPTAIFSSTLQQGLTSPWFFALANTSICIGLLLYVRLTRQWSAGADSFCTNTPRPKACGRRWVQMILCIILFCTFLFVYLRAVPWFCTSVYALVFDPNLTLMAREISLKLVQDKLATLLFSLNINVLGPLISALSILIVSLETSYRNKVCTVAALGMIAFLVVCSNLANGAKGNLIPAVIVALIVVCCTPRALFSKVLWGGGILLGTLIIMMVIEIRRDYRPPANRFYPIGICVREVGDCEEGAKLVNSLRSRRGTYGVRNERVPWIEDDFSKSCPDKLDEGRNDLEAQPLLPGVAGRVGNYFGAFIRRMIIVPLQVAAWHMQYADTYGRVSGRYLPGARYLYGQRIVDLPQRIYQTYAPIYTQGARDSTGNSPTGFHIYAIAHLGALGVFFSLLLIGFLDWLILKTQRFLSGDLGAILSGFGFLLATNLMLTDFDSAILSHGFFFAIPLIFILGCIDKYFFKVGHMKLGPTGR